MKTRWILGCIAALALTLSAHAQVDWSTAGNNINTNEWFGAGLLSTIPLSFETRVNQPIQWRTNNTLRMRLLGTNTTQAIGTYLNQTVSGNLGVGLFNTPNVTTPWSLLHLDNGGFQSSGYRPWHRPGMTITNGTDLGWIGLKDEGGDRNHLTLAWADNSTLDGPDLFKIVFLANPNTMGTAGTLDGLETMRILPAGTGMESFFGVGDFFTGGVDPTERLHLLDGRIRIQQLPDDAEAPDLTKVLVVDDVDPMDPEYGVVKWRNVAGFVNDCDWQMQTNNDVSTAYPGNTCPPIEINKVGIGLQDPKAKLHVFTHKPSIFSNRGIHSQMWSDEEGGWSIHGEARSIASNTFNQNGMRGVVGEAGNCKFAIGVEGRGGNAEHSPGIAEFVVGVKGDASAVNNATLAIGVWGTARGASNGQDWAAWFDGFGFITAPFWVYSDATLKENVESLTGSVAMDKIMALQPKSYNFSADQTTLALPGGVQRGFISQEVEAVLPDLVKNVHRPPVLDTAGFEVEPAMDLKAMNYEGLIPILVAAMQEQNARMHALEEQLNACCTAGSSDQRSALPGQSASGTTLDTDLRIIPNPVADQTELRYTVGIQGHVRLEITDASGRMVQAQDEGMRATGIYSYGWNTTMLAPGTYFCTLYMNDEPLVKKAVKLNSR